MKKHKPIRILDQKKLDQGWEFVVAVDGFTYDVRLEEVYYQKLTTGKVPPDHLIKSSLEFLLEREQPEQILRQFNLRQINQYFPDYEDVIKANLGLTKP